jgi:hypothetical protein
MLRVRTFICLALALALLPTSAAAEVADKQPRPELPLLLALLGIGAAFWVAYEWKPAGAFVIYVAEIFFIWLTIDFVFFDLSTYMAQEYGPWFRIAGISGLALQITGPLLVYLIARRWTISAQH